MAEITPLIAAGAVARGVITLVGFWYVAALRSWLTAVTFVMLGLTGAAIVFASRELAVLVATPAAVLCFERLIRLAELEQAQKTP